jgi:DNA-directed RNA polymerase subunit RPC12/RpoP
MTHYSRHWTCERCGREEESVDWPRTKVCERCVGAGLVVMRHTESSQMPLLRIAEDAYLRGYKHGKKVATEEIMGVEDA